jgi:hypothetical protein
LSQPFRTAIYWYSGKQCRVVHGRELLFAGPPLVGLRLYFSETQHTQTAKGRNTNWGNAIVLVCLSLVVVPYSLPLTGLSRPFLIDLKTFAMQQACHFVEKRNIYRIRATSMNTKGNKGPITTEGFCVCLFRGLLYGLLHPNIRQVGIRFHSFTEGHSTVILRVTLASFFHKLFRNESMWRPKRFAGHLVLCGVEGRTKSNMTIAMHNAVICAGRPNNPMATRVHFIGYYTFI